MPALPAMNQEPAFLKADHALCASRERLMGERLIRGPPPPPRPNPAELGKGPVQLFEHGPEDIIDRHPTLRISSLHSYPPHMKGPIIVGGIVGLLGVLVLAVTMTPAAEEPAPSSVPGRPDPFATLDEKRAPSAIVDPILPATTTVDLPRRDGPPKAAPRLLTEEAVTYKKTVLPIQTSIPAAFRDAGLSDLLDTVDDILIGRLDVYAHLIPGTRLILWQRDDSALVGLQLALTWGTLTVGYYGGEYAPKGWYDEQGYNLKGPILGRPLQLSKVTSTFGQRLHPITKEERLHKGTDYGVPEGTPVHVVADGEVKEAGFSASAGNYVKLFHDRGYESWYLHLSSIDPAIRKGARVTQNQTLGLSGNTGASTGPHLHYELRRDGVAMDNNKTLPLPSIALGPLATPAHKALLQTLR
jgi:murein DD-endopeptidase MepM/ murein hydrolase activator NlpD